MQEITLFNDFKAQLAQFKQENKNLVFNYDTEEGEKEVRSHVYKLRQSKAAVDKARKAAKAEQQSYLKAVEAAAQGIISEFESLIEYHMQPIVAKEEASTKLQELQNAGSVYYDSVEDLNAKIEAVETTFIDESFGDKQEEALEAKEETLRKLQQQQEQRALEQERQVEKAIENLDKELQGKPADAAFIIRGILTGTITTLRIA